MRSAALLTLAVGLTACGAAPAPSTTADALDIHITPSADLRTLDARICADPLPARLIPGVPDAIGWTRDLRIIDGPALTIGDGGVDVPPGTRCVAYTVDLQAAAEDRTEGVLRASPGRWLWRPRALPAPEDLRARLTADLGDVDLSLPWPRVDGGWRIPWNGFRYRSNALFGRFERVTLPVPGGALDVAFIGRPNGDRARFERWLTASAADLVTVFGRFPVPSAQVIVIFQSGARVGFGATARGGGPGAILYVGVDTTADTLTHDWTATHELFHLGMPLIRREDAWLSEGVTTVYTYLAMGRAGRLTPSDVRDELAGGFQRGATWSTGEPLGEDSVNMHRTGAWWRVYWGGGAWAFERALALLGSPADFDGILRLWSTAALDPGPARSAMALLRWADRIHPEARLVETATPALAARRFPDTAPLLQAFDRPAVRAALLTPAQPTSSPTAAAAE